MAIQKILFTIAITLFSWVFISMSINNTNNKNKEEEKVIINIDEGEKFYEWKENSKTFEKKTLSWTHNGDNFYYHQFSPIDGIYYRSDTPNPITKKIEWDKQIISLGTGVFICNFSDVLVKYEIRIPDAIIEPLERGVFLVDTTGKEQTIFSFNTFLQIGLLEKKQIIPTVQFNLLPSLLFKFDPTNTSELKNADIIRIATIHSIRYMDFKNPLDIKLLFAWNREKDFYFVESVINHISNRIESFKKLNIEILSKNDEKLIEDTTINTDSMLFINNAKRTIIFQNLLFKEMLKIFRQNWMSNTSNIKFRELFTQLKNEEKEIYEMSITMIKRYYYIASFAHFLESNNNESFIVQKDTPLLLEVNHILWGKRKFNDSYRHLSDMYAFYYFSHYNSEHLNTLVNNFLANLIENKILQKEEFLPFTFFVTEYLAWWPFISDKDTIQIISHLLSLTNDYFSTRPEDDKRLPLLSTIFYNYNRIFTKFNTVFEKNFCIVTQRGLIFQPKYLNENKNVTFPKEFTIAFEKLITFIKSDISNKKQIFYTLTSIKQNSNTNDQYIILNRTLWNTYKLSEMFLNYPNYKTMMSLNDVNKKATGILFQKKIPLYIKEPTEYLSRFNNIDLSTIRVINNFIVDNFYKIIVNIWTNIFTFNLWREEHVISDISYTDSEGKKYTFPDIIITLDKKEEEYKEKFNWKEWDERYLYDFKNFFETTFIKTNYKPSASKNPSQIELFSKKPPMSENIITFIQKNLIEKDFKNFENFLRIPLSNIYVAIENGEYKIDVYSINKAFQGKSNTYQTEIAGKYIFKSHLFSWLNLQVKKEEQGDKKEIKYEFGDAKIAILPNLISIRTIEPLLKDLWFYIDTIKWAYNWQKNITINFEQKLVLIDGIPYTPDFSINK